MRQLRLKIGNNYPYHSHSLLNLFILLDSYTQLLNELNYLDNFISLPIIDYLTNENISELTQFIQSAFILALNVCISELIATKTSAANLNKTINSTNGYDAIIETNLIQTCVCLSFLSSLSSHYKISFYF
jgi:hypothetical protein